MSRGGGASTTVVVLGDASCVRDVFAALRHQGWGVRRPRGDEARAEAVVTVVETVPVKGAARIVSTAQALGDAVVVVVVDPTVEDAHSLVGAGADAVVASAGVETHLAVAIEAVRAGLVAVPRALRQAIERPALTPREKQVLGMVVLGFSNADIAGKLCVAQSTVKSHLSSAFAKLGVRTRSEAAALILDRSHGLGTGILSIVGEGEADAAA